jgi:hypothetical protein
MVELIKLLLSNESLRPRKQTPLHQTHKAQTIKKSVFTPNQGKLATNQLEIRKRIRAETLKRQVVGYGGAE